MADISSLSRVINGFERNLDLTSNTLVTLSIKVGGGTPTELTKTILDNLIALQNGSDFANGTNAHTHDGRYYTETELGSQADGASGASKIGIDVTPAFTNFTSGNNVQSALEGINTALGSGGANKADRNLGNLTSPTAINQHLLPSAANTIDIGAISNQFRDLRVNAIRTTYDSVRVLSVDEFTLNDISGNTSIDFTQRWLTNSSGLTTVNYNTSDLNSDASGGNSVLNWETGDFFNDAGVNTGNWKFQALLKMGLPVLDWNSLNLLDATASASVDWDGRKLKSGATTKLDWSGTNIDVNTRKIVNVVDPTNAQDVATKAYVDASSGSGNAINQLTGDVTTTVAVGSESKAATISRDAVTSSKIAASAIGAGLAFDKKDANEQLATDSDLAISDALQQYSQRINISTMSQDPINISATNNWKLRLWLKKTGAINCSDLTIDIRTDNSGAVDGLYASDLPLGQDLTTSYQMYEFDLYSAFGLQPVDLAPGTHVWVTITGRYVDWGPGGTILVAAQTNSQLLDITGAAVPGGVAYSSDEGDNWSYTPTTNLQIQTGTQLVDGQIKVNYEPSQFHLNSGLLTISNNSITGSMIVNGEITSSKIAANAVESTQLADNAVDTAAIQNSAVTNAKLAQYAVTGYNLNPSIAGDGLTLVQSDSNKQDLQSGDLNILDAFSIKVAQKIKISSMNQSLTAPFIKVRLWLKAQPGFSGNDAALYLRLANDDAGGSAPGTNVAVSSTLGVSLTTSYQMYEFTFSNRPSDFAQTYMWVVVEQADVDNSSTSFSVAYNSGTPLLDTLGATAGGVYTSSIMGSSYSSTNSFRIDVGTVVGGARLEATGSIADGSITSSKIADGAVTSSKIADGAIISGKIAASAVSGGLALSTPDINEQLLGGTVFDITDTATHYIQQIRMDEMVQSGTMKARLWLKKTGTIDPSGLFVRIRYTFMGGPGNSVETSILLGQDLTTSYQMYEFDLGNTPAYYSSQGSTAYLEVGSTTTDFSSGSIQIDGELGTYLVTTPSNPGGINTETVYVSSDTSGDSPYSTITGALKMQVGTNFTSGTVIVAMGGITNDKISASAAIAYSKLNLSNSIVAADIVDGSVNANKVALDIFDQNTITSSPGTGGIVQHAPKIVTSEIAGQTLAASTLFALRYAITSETAGRMYKADKDASSNDKFYVMGLTLTTGAISAPEAVIITRRGLLTVPSHGLTIGAPFYLANSGAVSSTAPSSTNEAIVRLGIVKDSDTLDIDIVFVSIN